MPFPNTKMIAAGFGGGIAVQQDAEYFDDFLTGGYGTTTGHKFASTADVAEWLYTALGGSTPTFVIKDAGRGGMLAAATGAATDNHGFECQLNGEGFATAADKDMYFEVAWQSRNSVTAIDWFFGFASTDTSIFAGVNNFIGFTSGVKDGAVLDGASAAIIARSGDDLGGSWTATQASQSTGISIVAATTTVLSCWVQMQGSNAKVHFSVNGNEKFTTTTIPDITASSDFMSLSFGAQNNGATQAILDIDYIYACIKR